MRDADESTERAAPHQPTETPGPGCTRRRGRFRVIFVGALARLIKRVVAWRECARSRRLLARRDDRMLRDIGIDRATAEDDSTSSFWRLR